MTIENSLAYNMIQRVNVGDFLTRSAARAPNSDAVIDGERRFTYIEFERYANRIANGLSEKGYNKGDVLALISENSAEFLAIYFACAKIGVVCLPINLFLESGEIVYVLNHSEAKGAVVTQSLLVKYKAGFERSSTLIDIMVVGESEGGNEDFKPILTSRFNIIEFSLLHEKQSDLVPHVEIEDRAPITYLYTSGTTSAPKGVVGSHLAIYIETLGTAIDTRMTASDRTVAMLPMFHTAQLNALCTPIFSVGGAVVVMKGFDVEELRDKIESEKITVLFGLPMMYRALVEAQLSKPRNIDSLRLAVYAMATMPDTELRQGIDTLKCDFSLMFGQTEMSPTATFFRPEHQLSHPGAVGTPSINVQVGIMDPEGNLLPQGQEGEIVYRSPQVLTCYLKNDDATREAFKFSWFHSGDTGYFDQDGILWFKDRFKDVIKSGGENVASLEVEKAIYEVDSSIDEVAVIGLPHQKWTEAITAVVTLRNDGSFDESKFNERLRNNLSPFKCPKGIIVVDSMPKTATGKIQKAELRKIHNDYYKENLE